MLLMCLDYEVKNKGKSTGYIRMHNFLACDRVVTFRSCSRRVLSWPGNRNSCYRDHSGGFTGGANFLFNSSIYGKVS